MIANQIDQSQWLQKDLNIYTNTFTNISPNDEIIIDKELLLTLKDFPKRNALIAIQFNLDQLLPFHENFDVSDTIFILELNEKHNYSKIITDDFLRLKNKFFPSMSIRIPVNILLLSVNEKLNETIETIIPLTFKFER